MNLGTFLSLLTSGQMGMLLALGKASRNYHRVAFLGSGLAAGLLQRLAGGPVPLNALLAELRIDPAQGDALRAWLRLGVELGELREQGAGFGLRSRLARQLVKPEHDAAAAFVEELALLHNKLIIESLPRLQRGESFLLSDQNARTIARSSRLAEPLIREAIDSVIPARGLCRLLEIGCGSAAYIRYAAERNRDLTAVGLELQPDAAALARENIVRWNLGNRVTIEVCDVRQWRGGDGFDLATLHQNIYYFPVPERVALLRLVRGLLKPGGRLLLTSVCQGPGSTAAVLNLWGSLTAKCGPLPLPAEMAAQLGEAGFASVQANRMAPGESFYTFTGLNPNHR